MPRVNMSHWGHKHDGSKPASDVMKCRVQSGCTFGLESEAVIIFHRDIYLLMMLLKTLWRFCCFSADNYDKYALFSSGISFSESPGTWKYLSEIRVSWFFNIHTLRACRRNLGIMGRRGKQVGRQQLVQMPCQTETCQLCHKTLAILLTGVL